MQPKMASVQPILNQQLLRFLLIGGTSVAIDLIAYTVLVDFYSTMVAKGMSYILGMIFGFFGNKYWTFESPRASISEPAIYIAIYAATLAFNIYSNHLCFNLLTHLQQSPRFCFGLAFLIATGASTVLNFIGMKYLAFRSAEPSIS